MFERSAGESRLLEKSKTEETLELSISKASMSTFMNFDIQNPYPKTQKCFFPLIFHLKKFFFFIFPKWELEKDSCAGSSAQIPALGDNWDWPLPWADKHFSITYKSLRQQTLAELYIQRFGDLYWGQSNPELEFQEYHCGGTCSP